MTTVPTKKQQLRAFVLWLAVTGSALTGCGGAINVQSSGGGADGFATLGAIMLGTATLRYIRDLDYKSAHDDPVPPPEVTPDQMEHDGRPDSRDVTETN